VLIPRQLGLATDALNTGAGESYTRDPNGRGVNANIAKVAFPGFKSASMFSIVGSILVLGLTR
jgi:hypothetical protein